MSIPDGLIDVGGSWGSIPSPSDNAINLGPLELRAYGLAIAIGAIAAMAIAQRRWAKRGGDPADISGLAVWALLWGLAGARLYHVITDNERFRGRWLHAFAVWEGGLGIPGGLLAGVLAGAWLAKRRGLPVLQLLDVVAPALPVAQAVGRLGNWFNQELFGGPTDLPWGLEIDPDRRPDEYATTSTFHPTFLYEALWNLALAGALVMFERHRLRGGRPGRLFALYVGGYALGRFWVESLRIDPASEILGLRVNLWTSAFAFLVAVTWLLVTRARAEPDSATDAGSGAEPETETETETGDVAEDATAEAETGTGAAEAGAAAESGEVSAEVAVEAGDSGNGGDG